MVSHPNSAHEDLTPPTSNRVSRPIASPSNDKDDLTRALRLPRLSADEFDEQVAPLHLNGSAAAGEKPQAGSSISPNNNGDKYVALAVDVSQLPTDTSNEQTGEPNRRSQARTTVKVNLGSAEPFPKV